MTVTGEGPWSLIVGIREPVTMMTSPFCSGSACGAAGAGVGAGVCWAQAAELAGKSSEANGYYAQLVKDCAGGSSARPELEKAKQLVAAK